MSALKLTYYLDVLSSWCFAAESSLARLREDLGRRLDVEWRIAYLFGGGRMGYAPATSAWQYRRLKSVSGVELNPAWRESADDTTWFANLATEAARGLGIEDDRVRLAMARAAMIDGRHVGRKDIALHVAAQASGLRPADLEREMDAPRTEQRMHLTTQSYKALGLQVQPAFVFRNDIEDTAILSGLFRYETLRSCGEEMLAADDGYAAFSAAHPDLR